MYVLSTFVELWCKMYKNKLPELYLLSHQTQYMAIIAVFPADPRDRCIMLKKRKNCATTKLLDA